MAGKDSRDPATPDRDGEAELSLSCPIPLRDYPRVLLAHGGGGRLMQDLIGRMFAPAFAAPQSEADHDGAVLPWEAPAGGRLAFTTDSYVVRPLFFPGGDIGSLAVHGTVNDLAMCGARPLYLSAGFIVEEGLPMETLWRVVRAMRAAAAEAGVQLVTGDTKVVDAGKGDGLYLNTAGVGLVSPGVDVHPRRVCPDDAVLLSGDLGRHGTAILSEREGLAFETTLATDSAPVAEPVQRLLAAGVPVHCLRDCTRGGLAAALVEIARTGGARILVDEGAIPVDEQVQGACEILGLDPLHVANEGRFVAFVPQAEAGRALELLRAHPVAAGAVPIGRVEAPAADAAAGRVVLRSHLGTLRVVELPSGEQLPRIC